MSHLKQQMHRIMAYRDTHGYETNARALRLWLEWALNPNWEYAGEPLWKDRRFFAVNPVDEYDGESALLSPGGLLFTVPYGGHWCFGRSCLGEDSREARQRGEGGLQRMENCGWLHISGYVAYHYWPMTPRQERVWSALCERHSSYRLKDMEAVKANGGCSYEAQDTRPLRLLALERGDIADYCWHDDMHWRNVNEDAERRYEARASLKMEAGNAVRF